MSWRENYRQATFRGIPFFVDSHDAKFGRRQATHEYPQRDKPYTEDLGRAAQEFSISGYLLGDDYQATRDQLITECQERTGPGELVHPYLGNLDVVCLGLTVRESKDEGGTCALQLTFIESGEAQYPSDANDAVKSTSTAAAAATGSSLDAFDQVFTVAALPSFVVDAAIGDVQGLAGLLGTLALNPTGPAQTIAAFTSSLIGLADGAALLIESPRTLGGTVIGILQAIAPVFGPRAPVAYRALLAAYALQAIVAAATPSQTQRRANTAALAALVRRTALAEQAREAVIRAEEGTTTTSQASQGSAGSTTAAGFETREEAIAVRDEIIDALDVEMEDPAATTEEFQALTTLRLEVVRGVPSPELRLPQVASFTPRATLPSLVVAYGLYADASRGAEIAERNGAIRPGFLIGGEALEVITDA